ncbi:MAG: translation initiation factor IF-2, partial [Candidatus Brocadiae bacterium]|nr:translation initiation factor IF-2 [Candidatus Brocadiia bacterium]
KAAEPTKKAAEPTKKSVAPVAATPAPTPAAKPAPTARSRPVRAETAQKRRKGRRPRVDQKTVEATVRRTMAATAGDRRPKRRRRRERPDGTVVEQEQRLQVPEFSSVAELAESFEVPANDIIKKCLDIGLMVTINQRLDEDTILLLADEFDEDVEFIREYGEDILGREEEEAVGGGEELPRAPVVVVMGHVDHGKTSLLDQIRKTNVAGAEAGGITQHIGAYRVQTSRGPICFLDTPGHEAFTAMRARGANMTDVVVLVVAADDGVMPQTVEAISHARAAEVPIVVALNKIDLPNANVQRVLGQLAEHDLQPREWGGQTEVIQTSAETGDGIDSLVETLSLEAELLELKAEVDAPAVGYVIESEMDPGRGVVARLLVLEGTLNVGDVLLAGGGYGRVRQITDSRGESVASAGPSTPVEVSGLDEVPKAGDRFYVLADLDQARQVTEERRAATRVASLATGTQVTLENLFSKIKQGQIDEANLILKADVQGSLEALIGSLDKLSTEEIRLNVLHTGVGGISTGDVALAEASGAIVLGFNVVAGAAARSLAEKSGVDIRLYRVIYDIIDDMRAVLEEGLAPEIREEALGRAEVRQVFKVSRIGSIAGCYMTEGRVMRNAMVRIVRESVVIEDERTLESLKRFKDDVREVRNGLECGIKLRGYDDIKEGDELEFYRRVEVGRRL